MTLYDLCLGVMSLLGACHHLEFLDVTGCFHVIKWPCMTMNDLVWPLSRRGEFAWCLSSSGVSRRHRLFSCQHYVTERSCWRHNDIINGPPTAHHQSRRFVCLSVCHLCAVLNLSLLTLLLLLKYNIFFLFFEKVRMLAEAKLSAISRYISKALENDLLANDS